jgi:precorrin-3B synthase
MSRPAAKGWCPSALRPMKSGDGLLVRIKPKYGLLNSNQLLLLANCSDDFGNGLLDVTSRTNLQIRGVKEQNYSNLILKLQTQGLVSTSEKLDRLNVIVPPFIQKNSLTWRCVSQIYSSVESLPLLPEKFGFCIDCDESRYLSDKSGDLFIEGNSGSELMLRCAGLKEALSTDENNLIGDVKKIIGWYLEKQTVEENERPIRMRDVISQNRFPWKTSSELKKPLSKELTVGSYQSYFILAAPFGQLKSEHLRKLAAVNKKVQFTINRMLIVESLPDKNHGLVDEPKDNRLKMDVCPGAPHCSSATIKTRHLAESLAHQKEFIVGRKVHISGCSKGCASPNSKDICIVGNEGGFDIIEEGYAWDKPVVKCSSQTSVLEHLRETRS